MADKSYDIIIIGGGPGGYVAAIRAAQLGLKTAVVEREHLGGICSNWGCIPTKALLRSAEIMHQAQHAKDYGLKLDGTISADVKAVVDRARGIAQRMNSGVGMLMKKNKVDVIWGEAKFSKPNEIKVSKPSKKPMEPAAPAPKNTLGEGTYSAKHIVVATGARPRSTTSRPENGAASSAIWSNRPVSRMCSARRKPNSDSARPAKRPMTSRPQGPMMPGARTTSAAPECWSGCNRQGSSRQRLDAAGRGGSSR